MNNISVKEMKKRNREAGFNFSDLMKKYEIQIEISPNWFGYFLTSGLNRHGCKTFTIRQFVFKTGEIIEIKNNIKTKEDAKEELKYIRHCFIRDQKMKDRNYKKIINGRN